MSERLVRITALCRDCSWFSTEDSAYRAARRHALRNLHTTTTEKVTELEVNGKAVMEFRAIKHNQKVIANSQAEAVR